jgi:DNA-binding transcriptional regulator YdaS (Cro superfamily)
MQKSKGITRRVEQALAFGLDLAWIGWHTLRYGASQDRRGDRRGGAAHQRGSPRAAGAAPGCPVIGAATTVLVTRSERVRVGRCIEWATVRYDVAVGDVDGEPRLLDTRTGEPWTGAFTPAEQAEADALLERARVMRRLDEQRWPLAEAA